MALKDIIGQDRALHILKGCKRRNRIPHAMLFAGDEGVGKMLTAVNFAKALNCNKEAGDELFADHENAGSDYSGIERLDACDECPSCRKIDKHNHPDVFVITPEGAGRQINVAAIRNLGESLSFKPFEGNWKVAIVDDADRLNQSSANAFLQTLEEPSSQSVLILVSSRPDMLLPTIRSRCHRINFSPLPLDKMSTLLNERFKDFSIDQTMLLSTLSGGRLGYALNEDLIEKRDRSFEILNLLVGRLEEDVWDDRDAMEEWFDWAQLWLRDIAVFKATERTDLLINRDKEIEIKAFARETTLRNILTLAREIYNLRKQLYFNLNKQLTLNYTSLLFKRNLGKNKNREH